MLRETVRQHIDGLPDQELIAYIETGAEVYEPEAIAYATEELDRRQVAPQILDSSQAIARQHLQRIEARNREVAERPLDLYDRVLAFVTIGALLSPHHFLNYVIADVRGGYHKAREWSKFGRLGGCSYLSLGGLAMLIFLENRIAQIIGGAAFIIGT